MKRINGKKILSVVILFLICLLFMEISCTQKVDEKNEWSAISELKPDMQDQIIEKAKEFVGIINVQNVTYPRVVSSHTRFVNVSGIDEDSVQIVVGVDPITKEVVKMVRLCPRKIKDATEVKISKEQAESKCLKFLKSKKLSIPENYELDEPKVVSVGPWKRWKFVWHHIENDIEVLSDFIVMEVNASEDANIILYSKVHHDIMVDLTPKINVREARDKAIEFMKEVREFRLVDTSLSVVYPNNFFRKQTWEWNENQALCWILKFNRGDQHVLEIWVDAVTGVIHGGIMCHTHSPEVFGIDSPGSTHMQSHLNNIWSPYLGMMKYDVSSFNWTNANAGFTEATISTAISNGKYFIVEGHGDVTATAEKMNIAYTGSDDEKAFTPDEVPVNNLRFAFLDVCQSGEDGTGSDFKDVFISQGGDVFIGFDDYMCAWNYEESLLHSLAQGNALANAHSLAVADVNPWYTIVITYNVACLNMVRLAPLLVTVSRSPYGNIGSGTSFTVSAEVVNREDVDHTAATNVNASLVLPTGFTITSGANPQNVGTINWGSTNLKTATWTVTAPTGAGLFTLDVEVWSDNLGVEVDDPDNPYHKFEVNVVTSIGCCGN